MSLAKLTSISTQTLSLLLERQRLPTATDLHVQQIGRNLRQLRAGIIELQNSSDQGQREAVNLLKSQYGRMKDMLSSDAQEQIGVESLEESQAGPSSPPFVPQASLPPKDSASVDHVFTPYTDDPDAEQEPGIMLQTQRHIMDEQDTHLDRLSQSIGRQHHISLQINDELDVHTGLLDELDGDLDRTAGRLSGARKRLDKVAKGLKGNGSTVIIAILILVLLILIVVFKT